MYQYKYSINSTVSRSRCASVVGLEGIVLQETQNTFKIIGIDDRVRSK